MIEFIGPYLLVVMVWDPSVGMESLDVRLRHRETLEHCKEAGRDLEKLHSRLPAETHKLMWRCVPTPEKPKPIEQRTIPDR